MKFVVALVLYCLLFLPHFAFAAVVINEIAWMGTAVSTADEWMELVNDGPAAVDLTGWRLEATDGVPAIALSGSMSAGSFFLLERTDDGTVPGITANLIYTGALSNSGETLILKDASGAAVETVDASGGWPAGDNATKDTMQRSGTGWITASPTPRAANAGSTSSAPQPVPPAAEPTPAPPSPQASAGAAPAPSLGADAGSDVVAIAGAIVQFNGLSFGLDGKPLDGARFFWNFGDGSTQEARSPTHIFYFPGTYHANLLVQSGYYAGSDWRTITVLPAEISISEIQPGENGFIEIANASAARVDIGGVFLTDDQRFVFRVPSGTVIGPKGVVVLPSANTHLAPTTYLDLRDARGVTLDVVRFSGSLPAGTSWEREGYDFRAQPKPTPGTFTVQGTVRQTGAAVPRTNPVPSPNPSPPMPAHPAGLPPAPTGEIVSAMPPAPTPPRETAAIGDARSMPYVFFAASVILGLITAAGMVVLKRMAS